MNNEEKQKIVRAGKEDRYPIFIRELYCLLKAGKQVSMPKLQDEKKVSNRPAVALRMAGYLLMEGSNQKPLYTWVGRKPDDAMDLEIIQLCEKMSNEQAERKKASQKIKEEQSKLQQEADEKAMQWREQNQKITSVIVGEEGEIRKIRWGATQHSPEAALPVSQQDAIVLADEAHAELQASPHAGIVHHALVVTESPFLKVSQQGALEFDSEDFTQFKKATLEWIDMTMGSLLEVKKKIESYNL